MAQSSDLHDRITLAIARADGQDWKTLDDAPSRAAFMGYPQMAEAVLAEGVGAALPPEPAPDPVLTFLGQIAKDHIAASSRLTDARDRVARLRADLAAAEANAAEAERHYESVTTIVRDALDLARTRRTEATS